MILNHMLLSKLNIINIYTFKVILNNYQMYSIYLKKEFNQIIKYPSPPSSPPVPSYSLPCVIRSGLSWRGISRKG